jgi:putative transposase
MARIARVVAPGIPHHITQRGNRRQATFFNDDDYRTYIQLMAEWCLRCGVEIWAYCLMTNHVHLVAVPESEEGLRRAIGEAHRRYSRHINFQKGWRGHLWQGRFASYPMDERYLLAVARYVELNPVRAGATDKAEQYPWSSAAAHIKGRDDQLVKVSPLRNIVRNWRAFLAEGVSVGDMEKLRRHERTGRPLGNDGFIVKLEKTLKRRLQKQKPGPKLNKGE